MLSALVPQLVPIGRATASVPAGYQRNAVYDIVLLAHVLAAMASLGSVAVAGGHALSVHRSPRLSEAARRYYRVGTNWSGRVLFAVPVLGMVLVAMGHGEWAYSDTWVIAGLVLWSAAAFAAEMGLWPAERRLQEQIAGGSSPADLGRLCLRVVAAAASIAAILVAAAVVMVGKP